MAAQTQRALSILRRPQVEERTGLGRSTIYDRIKAGTFPAPVALGARSVGWDEAAVDAWVADRLKNGGAERLGRIAIPGKTHKA